MCPSTTISLAHALSGSGGPYLGCPPRASFCSLHKHTAINTHHLVIFLPRSLLLTSQQEAVRKVIDEINILDQEITGTISYVRSPTLEPPSPAAGAAGAAGRPARAAGPTRCRAASRGALRYTAHCILASVHKSRPCQATVVQRLTAVGRSCLTFRRCPFISPAHTRIPHSLSPFPNALPLPSSQWLYLALLRSLPPPPPPLPPSCLSHTHTHTRRAEGFDKNDHRMGAGVVVHHTSMKRNKRCLLAYM